MTTQELREKTWFLRRFFKTKLSNQEIMLPDEALQLPPSALLKMRYWMKYDGGEDEGKETLEIGGQLFIQVLEPYHIVQVKLPGFLRWADREMAEELITIQRIA